MRKEPRPGDLGYIAERFRYFHEIIKLTLADVPRRYLVSFVEHNSHAEQGQRFGPPYCSCRSCSYIRTRISQYFQPAVPKSPPPQAPREERPNPYVDFLERMGIGNSRMWQKIREITAAVAEVDEAEVARMVEAWKRQGWRGRMDLVVRMQSGEIVGLSGPSTPGETPAILVESSIAYKAQRRSLFPQVYQNDFPAYVPGYHGAVVQQYIGQSKEGA